MKKIISLALLISFFISSEILAAEKEKSLFDNPDKDAESAVQLELEKDRPVSQTENRRFIQPKEDYWSKKISKLEERLKTMDDRISSLEKELNKTRKEETKNEPVRPTALKQPAS